MSIKKIVTEYVLRDLLRDEELGLVVGELYLLPHCLYGGNIETADAAEKVELRWGREHPIGG